MTTAMRFARGMLAACALTACATFKPGEDPVGIAARDHARPVLPALVKYKKVHGEYPLSLHELVPKFLPAVPFDPGLRYDRDSGTIDFAYSPDWPRQDPVNCGAKLGDTDWTCAAP